MACERVVQLTLHLHSHGANCKSAHPARCMLPHQTRELCTGGSTCTNPRSSFCSPNEKSAHILDECGSSTWQGINQCVQIAKILTESAWAQWRSPCQKSAILATCSHISNNAHDLPVTRSKRGETARKSWALTHGSAPVSSHSGMPAAIGDINATCS